jgi:hypothetical protein
MCEKNLHSQFFFLDTHPASRPGILNEEGNARILTLCELDNEADAMEPM